MSHRKLFSFALALVSAMNPLAAASYYSITVIGDANPAIPMALNAAGTAVGYAYPSSGANATATNQYAALFDGTRTINLGTLSGDSASLANAINSGGKVIGNSVFIPPAGTFAPFVYRAVLFSGTGANNIDLGTLGGDSSYAIGINAGGQIVGAASTAGNQANHATLFSGTGTANADLGTLGGKNSVANAINDLGQIVGSSDTSSGGNHATLFSSIGNIDLGTLDGADPAASISWATAINNSGQIVGGASSGSTHAILFSGTGTGNIDIQGNEAIAYAINNNGLVVGSFVAGDHLNHAFLYTDGETIDLNTLVDPAAGWLLVTASAINDAGQILVMGYKNGPTRALLLTPASVRPPSITPKGSKFIMTEKSLYTLQGRAKGVVTRVMSRRDAIGSDKLATGTLTWRAKNKLRVGRNVFLITAYGPGGRSKPARITITRKVATGTSGK